MPLIRIAQLGDAKALAALAEKTFRDTFGSMNTFEDMNLHCQSSYGESIQLAEITDPQRLTLVCELGEHLIAFAQLNWSEGPSCVPGKKPGEIQRLYVEKAWHGKGIAQDLMDACLQEMAKAGSDTVWLGVWEHNPRAIAFYQKFGFLQAGDHVFPLGTDPQRDLILTRPVEKGLKHNP